MLPNRVILAVLAVLLTMSNQVSGQSLYQDIQREFADENQLQRDVRRYQHDVATGHFWRAAVDRARIQNDEASIRTDQAAVQNDLAYQGRSLIPHPQYPSLYYDPSQPAQLYSYPATRVASSVSTSPTFVGPPIPASTTGLPMSANLPSAPTMVPTANPLASNIAPPLRTITALISNPADSGVAINFAVDGVAYSVPSGYTQKLVGTTSSVVEFDRGDQFGIGRYGLTAGPYEFRYTLRGWELYKMPLTPPARSSGLLPRNEAPGGLAAAKTGPSPFSETQLPAREAVPPAPTPEIIAPR